MIPLTASAATFISNSSGKIIISIQEATQKTFYLVLILPSGNLKISSAITFA